MANFLQRVGGFIESGVETVFDTSERIIEFGESIQTGFADFASRGSEFAEQTESRLREQQGGILGRRAGSSAAGIAGQLNPTFILLAIVFVAVLMFAGNR